MSRIDPAQLDQLLHPQFDVLQEVRGPGQRSERQPRRRRGRGRVLERRRRRAPPTRATRCMLGPLGDQPRRPEGHGRRRGHPDQPRRQDEPCRRYRPRHGYALRLRCRALPYRRRREGRASSRAPIACCARATSSPSTALRASLSMALSIWSSAELTGDLDTILSWADEIRLDETDGHANHVRVNADNPEDAAARARVWRRGHRPVPHRAHVPGRSQEHHPELHPVRRRGREAAGPGRSAQGPD